MKHKQLYDKVLVRIFYFWGYIYSCWSERAVHGAKGCGKKALSLCGGATSSCPGS